MDSLLISFWVTLTIFFLSRLKFLSRNRSSKNRIYINNMSSGEDSEMGGFGDSEMSSYEDSESSFPEDSQMTMPEDFVMSTPEDAILECYCGYPAKLRVSNTPKNPSRLFYNCPRTIANQCGYFQWADELSPAGDKHTRELNLIRYQCTRLQERFEEVQARRDNDRRVWQGEISELMTKLSIVQAELDGIKNRIKDVNESELMPPVDTLCSTATDDGRDDAKVIYAIQASVFPTD